MSKKESDHPTILIFLNKKQAAKWLIMTFWLPICFFNGFRERGSSLRCRVVNRLCGSVAVEQGCQAHFHQGPDQPYGWPGRTR